MWKIKRILFLVHISRVNALIVGCQGLTLQAFFSIHVSPIKRRRVLAARCAFAPGGNERTEAAAAKKLTERKCGEW